METIIKKEDTLKKRGWVRGLWGIINSDDPHMQRIKKIYKDIELVKHCKFQKPFKSYVWGEDNYKYLVDNGFNDNGYSCVLVDKNPVVWDNMTQYFRHKMEVWRLAAEEFDEFVFLDWDTLPILEQPDNFWEVLAKKHPLQAVLRQYMRRKALWRRESTRQVPCAAFVYIGDKAIPNKIIKCWEDIGKTWGEEAPMAKYMDEVTGGWKGLDTYWETFEPDFFVLNSAYVYPMEKLNTKHKCFNHFNERCVQQELNVIKSGNLRNWQKL